MMGSRTAAPTLDRLLRECDKDPDLQESATLALGLLGDPLGLKTLETRLARGGTDAWLGATSISLGLVGDHTAIDPLIRLVEDRTSAYHVARADAATALGLLTEPRLLPATRTVTANTNYLALGEALEYLAALW